MKITIKDIARELNLSTTAVSLVLNNRQGKSYISESTRQRILSKAAELGYTPNNIARALATGRTYAVRLIALYPERPYCSKIFHNLRLQADEDGYLVSFASHITPDVNQIPADGIIVLDNPKYVQSVLAAGSKTPIISIGGFYDENVDCVGVNLYSGASEAMSHLIGLGKKRIAYLVRDDKNLAPGEPRYDSYTGKINDSRLELEFIRILELSRLSARESVIEYVKLNGCPDALFCYNDDLAIGALKAFSDLGISVPDDVAIVGCDNIEDSEYHNPALSTISQPIEEMCSIAWKYLQNRIENPSIPLQQTVLKASLVIRESSGN